MNDSAPPSPKKVLVDNCVLSLAETVQSAAKRTEVPWGGRIESMDIVGFAGKTPRDNTQQSQRECLPTIARLAQSGELRLYQTIEVDFEAWHRSGTLAPLPGYLFVNIPFSDIPSAVERSRIQQTDMSTYVQGDALAQFCKWLLGINEKLMLSKPTIRARFTTQEITNLENLDRFRDLCKGLSADQCRDAFHLWGAEVSGLDYFLTTDTKFIRALTMRGKKTDLPCLPITPSGLLDVMGVDDRDPLPFGPGQFYDILGRPE